MFTKLSVLLVALLSTLGPAQRLIERAGEAIAVELEAQSPSPDQLTAVQVELSPDPDGAETLANTLSYQLAERGSALEVNIEVVSGQAGLPPSYRVIVGPFEDIAEAEQARLELAALGVGGFVRNLESFVGC